MNTLLIWEEFPGDVRYFRLSENSDYLNTALASAGKYVGDEKISSDDAVQHLHDAIYADSLEDCKIQPQGGVIDETFLRVIICGSLV